MHPNTTTTAAAVWSSPFWDHIPQGEGEESEWDTERTGFNAIKHLNQFLL